MAGGEKDGAPETYDATIEARKKQRIRIQKIKEKKQAKKAVEDVKIETDVHETLATLDEAELKLKNSNRESEAPSRLRNSEITDTTS